MRKDPHYAAIAPYLRRARKRAGLTQAELGERLGGVRQAHVSGREAGLIGSSIALLFAWARACGCSVRSLFPNEIPTNEDRHDR